MPYVAHPYASATPSPNSKGLHMKTCSQRPQIITSSIFFGATLPSIKASSSRSPSPISFAPASVIDISPLSASPLSSATACQISREGCNNIISRSKDEKRDRRRGLLATETQRVAGLDALLRVPEVASPRSVQQPRTPHVQLVRSTTNLSVTPSIVCRTPPRKSSRNDKLNINRNENENESDSGASSNPSTMCASRRGSPEPNSGSGSGSASSTPSQPRTPISIEFKFADGHEFEFPIVAPLSISKVNRIPSPAARHRHDTTSFFPSSPSPTPSSTAGEHPETGGVNLRRQRSRGRFSARTTATPSAGRIFAPLEVDTTIARCHNIDDDLPTLTGVLEEFEREALKIPAVPSAPADAIRVDDTKGKCQEVGVKDEDESEWYDIPEHEADRLEDAEYYRADIASHLQLVSSSSFPPLSRVSSYSRSGHRRVGSSSSSITMSRWQLPPARPDSMPPPPRSLPSFSLFTPGLQDEEGIPPSLPPLPALPALAEVGHQGFLRRASASSLASTASNRSTRSNRSSGSTSGRSRRRNTRRSVARRSAAAALGIGRRRSGAGLRASRPLPPVPNAANEMAVLLQGPNAALDPTYCELLKEEGGKQTRPRPPRSRPPPRFSIPVSVDEDDFDSVSVVEMGPESGMELMARVVEEDEDEDGFIDPFVLERFSVVAPPQVQPEPRSDGREGGGLDPFTTPPHSGRSQEANPGDADFPLSPSTSSPFFANEHIQRPRTTLPAVPESPAPSSFCGSVGEPSNSGETSITFDAQSLYSSYAAFSPAPSSSFASSCNSDDTSCSLVCERKESAPSIYLDASGRPLQSRWSVSTFASTVPPNTSSSARSFFPIPKLMSTVPSRLSARLRAAREKAVHQSREREEKERREGKDQAQVVRPFPFFPTPTPPSPKKKTNPGPGKYVPKPELMPTKERVKLGERRSPRSSVETVKTSSASSTSTHSSIVTSAKSRETSSPVGSNTSQSSPSHFKAQFAQYRAHKQSNSQSAHGHARSVSPSSSHAVSPSFTCSSPPRSGRSSLKSCGSTDSLSAFPFLIGGESLSPLSFGSGSGTVPASTSSYGLDAVNKVERSGVESGGLRRKGIPPELFA